MGRAAIGHLLAHLDQLAGGRGRTFGRDHRVEGRLLAVPRRVRKAPAHELGELVAIELLHMELVLGLALVRVFGLVGARDHEQAFGLEDPCELGHELFLLVDVLQRLERDGDVDRRVARGDGGARARLEFGVGKFRVLALRVVDRLHRHIHAQDGRGAAREERHAVPFAARECSIQISPRVPGMKRSPVKGRSSIGRL